MVGAVAGSAIGQTAQAGSPLCGSNKVCIYANAGFDALIGQRGPGGGVQNVDSQDNDQMSSWENKTGTNARWYVSSNGVPPCYDMPSNSQNSQAEFNDELSSWATNGSC